MRWVRVWMVLVVMSLPGGVAAQINVLTVPGSQTTDFANLAQNTITATEAVIHTAKWVLEQMGLPAFALLEGAWLEDLATLEQLVSEGQQVGMDLTSLQAQLSLLSLDSATSTSTAYAMHVGEIRWVVNQSYSYAMRTQTLIATTLNTIRHVTTLMNDVMVAVGAMQANQTMAQKQAQLVQIQSELKLQTSAFQHAEALDRLSGPLIEQSSLNMSQAMWADWAQGDIGL
jgi:hypothetical protein